MIFPQRDLPEPETVAEKALVRVTLGGGANVVPPPSKPFFHTVCDGFDSRQRHQAFKAPKRESLLIYEVGGGATGVNRLMTLLNRPLGNLH